MRLGLGLGVGNETTEEHLAFGANFAFAATLKKVTTQDNFHLGSTLKKVTAAFACKSTNHVALAATTKKVTAAFTLDPTAPFDPSQLTGLCFWLRTDLGLTVSGGVASNWLDQSGEGDSNRNAVAPFGTGPTYNASDPNYNGHPSLTFTGIQEMHTGVWSPAEAQPQTWFIVGNAGASGQFFLGGLDANAGWWVSDLSAFATYSSTDGTHQVFAVTSTVGIPSAIRANFNGANGSLAINQRTPQATGNDGGQPFTGIVLGNNAVSPAGVSPLNGPLVEVFAYDTILSGANAEKCWTYIASRYGLTIGA